MRKLFESPDLAEKSIPLFYEGKAFRMIADICDVSVTTIRRTLMHALGEKYSEQVEKNKAIFHRELGIRRSGKSPRKTKAQEQCHHEVTDGRFVLGFFVSNNIFN